MTIPERIHSSIRLLDQYLDELQTIFPDDFEEYQKSLIIRRSSERQIQIIIEQITDICALLYRYKMKGLAGDDGKILETLSHNCLSPELCEKIRSMKGFRSILVHGYTLPDDALVHKNIREGMADVYLFIEEAETCLQKN